MEKEKQKRSYTFKSDKRGGRKKKEENDKIDTVQVFITKKQIKKLGGKAKAGELGKALLQKSLEASQE